MFFRGEYSIILKRYFLFVVFRGFLYAAHALKTKMAAKVKTQGNNIIHHGANSRDH